MSVSSYCAHTKQKVVYIPSLRQSTEKQPLVSGEKRTANWKAFIDCSPVEARISNHDNAFRRSLKS